MAMGGVTVRVLEWLRGVSSCSEDPGAAEGLKYGGTAA